MRSRLSTADLEALRDALRIGLHEEVQVTASSWGAKRLATEEQRLGGSFFGISDLDGMKTW